MLGSGNEGNGRSVSSSNSSTIAALRDIVCDLLIGILGDVEIGNTVAVANQFPRPNL